MATNNKISLTPPSPLFAIEENKIINRWAATFARHPQQLNHTHEADAELLPNLHQAKILATTIDTICEEIELGFYEFPETMGQMAVIASLSDLAAVGATPLGILVSVTLGKLQTYSSGELQDGIARGIESICRRYHTYVLGGDTNFGEKTSLTVCALGHTDPTYQLTRKGARVGDLIYSTGLLGDGAALAAKKLYDVPDSLYQEKDYQPKARLEEGKLIATFASACMDTSDGLIATLDELSRVNRVGMKILTPLIEILNDKPRDLAKNLSVPPLAFLATQHGEFELIFTVPNIKKLNFEATAAQQNFKPILIGEVVEPEGVYVADRAINSTQLRNLLGAVNGNINHYLHELLALVQNI